MSARELQVRLERARHDQGVNDAFRDNLGQRVPQEVLHCHWPYVREKRCVVPNVGNVCQYRFLQRFRGCGGDAQHLACPAIYRTLEPQRRVLCGYMDKVFSVATRFMSYRDGETIDRALKCFETPFEGLCRNSPFRSAFLDEICFGVDQYFPEKALRRLIT